MSIEQVDSVPAETAIAFERLTYWGKLALDPVQPLVDITDEHSPFPSCP